MHADPYSCPEALRHGPPDGSGRCPWCRRRVEAPAPAPRLLPGPSDLTESYGYVYDPDDGALDPEQIARRYRMGMT